MAASLLTFALLSLSALAKPVQRTLQVHEARETAPNGYVRIGPAEPNTVLQLRIALARNNVAGLIDALTDVSDPSSDHYGQYLNKPEVELYVAPTSETTSAVNAWLKENGLTATTLSPSGDWIAITVPINQANSLIDADYSVFEHTSTGLQTVRTLSYSIPAGLIGYIDLVHPTISFPDPYGNAPTLHTASSSAKRSTANHTARDDNPCGTGTPSITPTCLQYLYGIPTTPAVSSSNYIAVAEYEEEYGNQADLQSFLEQFRPDMNSSTTFATQTLDGGVNPQNGTEAGTEANLDLQYTVGLATDVPSIMLSVGGDFYDGLMDTATYFLYQDAPPQVLSTSYGSDEDLVSALYADNLCTTWAQLGARGVSLIFSSGDGGVSGNHFQDCTTFIPTFPSSCPYITSVGATTDVDTEVGVDFSGGGFSNYFSRPSYQDKAVSNYLNLLGSNNSGLYNATGRGYPDVSAYGVQFDIVVDGYTTQVDGTSCSAPTFASVIALLNDRLVAAGKSTLGFLNPLLYSTGASALTDIVGGNNRACDNNTGFDAAVGWDPVTGLGTPNFASLQAVIGL